MCINRLARRRCLESWDSAEMCRYSYESKFWILLPTTRLTFYNKLKALQLWFLKCSSCQGTHSWRWSISWAKFPLSFTQFLHHPLVKCIELRKLIWNIAKQFGKIFCRQYNLLILKFRHGVFRRNVNEIFEARSFKI